MNVTVYSCPFCVHMEEVLMIDEWSGLADMLADSDVGASKGGLFDNSKTLSKLIGRPTTTLAESVSHLFNVNN